MKTFFRLALTAGALAAWMYRNAHSEKERKAIIHLTGKAEFRPFKLLFISDIHRRKLKRKMFGEKMELVIIGGDFVERGVPEHRIRENLKILSELAPVYYVFGNNDREVGEALLLSLFKDYGITVLGDESVELFGIQELKLVGIDYFAFKKNSLPEAFKEVRNDDSVIFVCHTPFIFKTVKRQYPVSLMLAGHTHGGQIRLGPFGIFEPGALTADGGIRELISNGFGTTSLPLRLGAQAEYHVLEIRPSISGKRLAQSPRIG